LSLLLGVEGEGEALPKIGDRSGTTAAVSDHTTAAVITETIIGDLGDHPPIRIRFALEVVGFPDNLHELVSESEPSAGLDIDVGGIIPRAVVDERLLTHLNILRVEIESESGTEELDREEVQHLYSLCLYYTTG
jgi:hypothetical protein